MLRNIWIDKKASSNIVMICKDWAKESLTKSLLEIDEEYLEK